ncbi:MAG: DUF3450 domain-containing protein [Cellvibrionales bacterium]|nr:DUF3450 domain-containing protein [Cellvibrionales bacterium]
MKLKRFKLAIMLATGLLALPPLAQAQTVDSVLQQSRGNTANLRAAQERIDGIAESTDKLLQEFKVVNKQIDGLKVYNAQQELQIADQRKSLDLLERSIANAATMERDIAPLLVNMIDGLEDFVELDLPFRLDERRERVTRLRNNLGRANLSVAEKFRQVLEAYKIELDYGNNIEAYTRTLAVDGQEQDVNVLRIGRIALTYQTKDQSRAAAWNTATGDWEALPGSWNRDISEGLKIARKQSPINIMKVPVSAPQEVTR